MLAESHGQTEAVHSSLISADLVQLFGGVGYMTDFPVERTVLKRIARATELLGYAPGERRLAVEVALESRRHLPPPPS